MTHKEMKTGTEICAAIKFGATDQMNSQLIMTAEHDTDTFETNDYLNE